MANYSTNEFRAGMKVMLDGDPCSILDNEFVKPGKGQAFNRVKLRNLKTGRQWERTFKSGETLEGADVVDRSMLMYTQPPQVSTLSGVRQVRSSFSAPFQSCGSSTNVFLPSRS